MSCAICQTRRPRRFCPGVHGDICAFCCGSQREVTVSCPSTCEYLQEARKHETPAPFDPATTGNPDILVTEQFLESHWPLLLAMSQALTAASAQSGVVDSDVREALASLIQTYRTLQSGVIYEGLPANPLAANLHRLVQHSTGEFRRQETQQLGITKTRDDDVLRVLVFFQRLALDRNNGRPRCRAFLEALELFEPVPEASELSPPPSLILS
jgi:hypothetical protein